MSVVYTVQRKYVCLYAVVDLVYAYATCYNLRLNWEKWLCKTPEIWKFSCAVQWHQGFDYYFFVADFFWYINSKHYKNLLLCLYSVPSCKYWREYTLKFILLACNIFNCLTLEKWVTSALKRNFAEVFFFFCI